MEAAGMIGTIRMLRTLSKFSVATLLWTLLIVATSGQDLQTVIFEPRDQYCVDEPAF